MSENGADTSQADSIRRDLLLAAENHRRLASERSRLLEEHGSEWVGVSEGTFLFAGSLEELLSAAKARGWDLTTLVVDYLEPAREPLLL